MAIQDNMNLPSSGASLSGNIAKSTTFMERFNGVLSKTLDMTNKISKNMGFTGGSTGGGAGNLTTSGSFTGGQPGGGMGTMAGLGSAIAKGATFALGGMSVAAQALPGLQDTLSTQLLTSQARFSGFQGNVTSQVRSAMMAGTTNSPYDAIQAVSQGTAAGLIPALPGYSGIMNGVAQISNLTGNMQSAMAATSALNQGASVNRLRMFGINVRNAQGTMRDPSAIFKDVYNFANQQSGKKLTKQDVAIGMQSGNGLANFMDFVSGGDSNLRGALQTAALQYSQGGDLSKSSLTQTGQLTSATNASSALNATKFGVTEAAAPAMSKGYVEGADLLGKFNNKLTDLIGSSKLANDALKQIAKTETIAADNLGQAAISLATLLGTAVGGSAIYKGIKSALSNSGTSKVIAPEMPGSSSGLLGPNGQPLSNVASTASKTGPLAAKVLGPIGIYYTAKSLFNSSKDMFSLSVLTGKRVADPNQSYMDSILHGTHYVDKNSISGNSTGGLGQDAATTPGVGYVSNASSGTPSTGSLVASAVVGVAASQQGTPYSWGGGNLSGPTKGSGRGRGTVGFDCSSLTRFAMAKLGIVLPRTAHEQQKCGIPIDPRQAQPGDLLFWGNPAHHVAIYAGNGMMIQAPRTGGQVERVGVDLNGVTSCSRVVNGVTGTAATNNLLDTAGGNVLSPDGAGSNNSGGVLASNTLGAGRNLFASGDLVGYSPDAAMSGGAVSSSGLGQGAATSGYQNTNTNTMAQQYLYVNSKTGTLETSTGQSSSSIINYGGVSITVETKGNSTPKEIGKAVREELKNIGINAKVVSK
jgi:cell wall-associated NlpC family hydrolase